MAWWHLPSLPQISRPVPAEFFKSTKLSEIANSAEVIRDISILRRTHLYMHETLRITGILLKPFMPEKSAQLLDALGISEEERRWEDAILGGSATMGIEKAAERYNSKKAILFPSLEIKGSIGKASPTASTNAGTATKAGGQQKKRQQEGQTSSSAN